MSHDSTAPASPRTRPLTMPAEWERQAGVLMIWPDSETDWADMLAEVRTCYCHILAALTQLEQVVLVVRHAEDADMLYEPAWHIVTERLHLVEAEYDDTWARDTAFLTRRTAEGQALLNFKFNGWGGKFEATRDNQLNDTLLPHLNQLLDGHTKVLTMEDHGDFVLEGGSVESDGMGTILTTTNCLLAPRRNQPLGILEIESRLKRSLGAKRILWLRHGHLDGDDTDGHIDTLARFAPHDTLLYIKDESLLDMERDLRGLRTASGQSYRLLPLPMARPLHDSRDGHRLPANYANFLVANNAVLCPTYGQPALDAQALRQVASAFPSRQTIPVDCRALIRQNGSLHCATMQFFSDKA